MLDWRVAPVISMTKLTLELERFYPEENWDILRYALYAEFYHPDSYMSWRFRNSFEYNYYNEETGTHTRLVEKMARYLCEIIPEQFDEVIFDLSW